MTFPLKPFLYLCMHAPKDYEQSAYTEYNAGVKALASRLGPIIPESKDYLSMPEELDNWRCREIAAILEISSDAIARTFLELHLDSLKQLDFDPLLAYNTHSE